MNHLNFEALPDPTSKFQLEDEIASGYAAKVYKAKDLESGQYVAIKIQPFDEEHRTHIDEEYRILRDYSNYPNIVDFHGVFRKKKPGSYDEVWFVVEYCEGGTAVDLVNRLMKTDRRMQEEHIAFILREAGKAIMELNRNHFIHRDVRGSNILLTRNGEVKLCDFGLTREVDSTFGKRGTCIGSPCWMSPELVTAQETRSHDVYDSRSDVWALGITAIELGDGRTPFQDMHPSRAMFQIVRNPPPTLTKISIWSQNYNDFIAECLEKNPENRAFMVEIIEHPFLAELPENDFTMQTELKGIIESTKRHQVEKKEELAVDQGYIKRLNQEPEKLLTEDLAAMENPSDEQIVDLLTQRMARGQFYSFIGDILLSLNSNDMPENYEESFHEKYKFKSRSENAPHIFGTADVAYQDMMHHKEPQHVLFAGESYSGKSTNVRLFAEHLFYLGSGNKGATERVRKAMKATSALVCAGTPLNPNSTRCTVTHILTFGSTGKLSGAVIKVNLLEKMRVSTTDMDQHNFHIFYYFYDFMEINGHCDQYSLEKGRKYRYLRIPKENQSTKLKYVRDNPQHNAEMYKEFEDILIEMDVSRKTMDTVRKIFAAILMLGDVRFKQNEKRAVFEDPDVPAKIAELLRLDEKKFIWSMLNYCKVKGGIAERKNYTAEEARDCRDALAATIYNRLMDWIVNKINLNLAFPRAVFGDMHSIHLYDMFGFECFNRNGIEQLMVNTLNEQMQYHYNQITFANAAYEQEFDGVPPVTVNYYDNKTVLDQLLTKPEGLFSMIDDASRMFQHHDAILEKVAEKRSQHIKKMGPHEIAVTHYTGKITYDVRGFADTNRDFVAPEMIESLRSSLDEVICLMFTNNLSKCGNLTMALDDDDKGDNQGGKQDPKKLYTLNTLSQGLFSQVKQMRSLATLFRTVCLQMLKTLACKADNAGCHFVRCIRADLEFQPRNVHRDMVLQQLKALAVTDTIIARQQGYSCRITFHEFLKRYQFLAFDFDETVDVTKDNCRLLLIRLKMEGWAIGKSKVFLRYYNDEYLARLYETQVKKIIKVQAMMRSYLARKRKGKAAKANVARQGSAMNSDQAAKTIQKAYRGYKVRRTYGPLLNEKTGQLDQQTANFLKNYVKRWRARSLFQVLLHYRAARFQDLVNLSQQVHLFNQRFVAALNLTARAVPFEKIDQRQTNPSALGPLPLPIRKIPFRLDEIPYFDTSYMCDIVSPAGMYGNTPVEEQEKWDAPLQTAPSLTQYLMTYNAYKKEQSCQTNWDRRNEADVIYEQQFSRDPRNLRRSSYDRSFSYQTNGMVSSSTNMSGQNNRFASSGTQDYRRSSYNPIDNRRPSYAGSDNRRFSSASQEFDPARRNSLSKKRTAPTPPPIKGMRNDSSWMNSDSRPSNPVRELQMMGRRDGNDNNADGDEPPFNFRAMLRKTNYSSKNEINNVYNSESRPSYANSDFGRREKSSSGGVSSARRDQGSNFQKKSVTAEELNESGISETPSYIEEEIAPGVTLQGNAYII